MKLLFSILIMMLFCVGLSAQKTTVQKKSPDLPKTSVVERKDAGRYEIIVAPYLVIKLDTFTGLSSSYSITAITADDIKWNPTSAKGLPDESSSVKSKYRIFAQESDKNAEQYYYLLNTETGQTWISRSIFKFDLHWEPLLTNSQ